MTHKLIGAAGALTVLALATGAAAQTAPAAAQPVATGPVIPGVCVYSNVRAIAISAVGKHVDSRMKQLSQAVEAELKAEGASLENEAKTLETQQATMANDPGFQQRAFAFAQKRQQFERKAMQRNRELEVTQAKAYERVAKEIQPLLQQTYNERNCGLLIDRNAVLAGNAQMDVTELVVQKLNGKIQTFAFDRERLDQQQQAAAKPAAPAAKK